MQSYNFDKTIKEATMIRKLISSLFLAVALLTVITVLAAAQGEAQAPYQMDMGTPTATLPPAATSVPDLPLSNSGGLPLDGSQTATCPMMGSMNMSGTGMSGMSMGGMSGMGMSGMSGMQGMQGMQSMPGMNMTGMNGAMAYYAAPWYTNPWMVLGWILVGLVSISILTGAVLIIRSAVRNSRGTMSVQAS
jgi:hypothetical protein